MQEKRNFWRNFAEYCFMEIARTVFLVCVVTGMTVIAIAAGGL